VRDKSAKQKAGCCAKEKTNLRLVQQLNWNTDCARHDFCISLYRLNLGEGTALEVVR
jgi:hypothetical protein